MDDYIKRSDALDRFTYEHGELMPEVLEDGSENTVGVKDVKSALRSIPAADVAPVVHARWETDEVTGEKYCSDCLERAVFTSGHFYHCADYCPHCGAKMDG